jgi:predicted nucleic acid-binding protein
VIALDTNVLARYLLADDAGQAERAARLLESGKRLFVPVTVCLELAWVLRSEGVGKDAVLEAFGHLRGLPHIEWQQGEAFAKALLWAQAGLDLADAIHLALAAHCESMASFDDRFVQRAGREQARPRLVEP